MYKTETDTFQNSDKDCASDQAATTDTAITPVHDTNFNGIYSEARQNAIGNVNRGSLPPIEVAADDAKVAAQIPNLKVVKGDGNSASQPQAGGGSAFGDSAKPDHVYRRDDSGKLISGASAAEAIAKDSSRNPIADVATAAAIGQIGQAIAKQILAGGSDDSRHSAKPTDTDAFKNALEKIQQMECEATAKNIKEGLEKGDMKAVQEQVALLNKRPDLLKGTQQELDKLKTLHPGLDAKLEFSFKRDGTLDMALAVSHTSRFGYSRLNFTVGPDSVVASKQHATYVNRETGEPIFGPKEYLPNPEQAAKQLMNDLQHDWLDDPYSREIAH